MIFEHQSKNKRLLLAIAVIFLLFGSLFLFHPIAEDKGQVSCTQEAKICPDGSSVGRTGPGCEFAACPEIELPQGYTLDSYSIEKVLNIACTKVDDCETPGEYLIMSRCPFTSICLDNKCTVVCPSYKGN